MYSFREASAEKLLINDLIMVQFMEIQHYKLYIIFVRRAL